MHMYIYVYIYIYIYSDVYVYTHIGRSRQLTPNYHQKRVAKCANLCKDTPEPM